MRLGWFGPETGVARAQDLAQNEMVGLCRRLDSE